MSPAPLSIEPSNANTEAIASSRDRVAGWTVLQREPLRDDGKSDSQETFAHEHWPRPRLFVGHWLKGQHATTPCLAVPRHDSHIENMPTLT
jgi:hypothetical protein